MNLQFGPELQSFQTHVRDVIRAKLPAELRQKVEQERMDLPKDELLAWQRVLYEQGGWSCPSWPTEHGGPGWDFERQYIFERELALANAPRPLLFGSGMLGPAVIEFGTEEQKLQHLPGILKGEVMWCQGYSEPNAGSDLASLQCRARRDGDHYVLNGSKMWTTDGHIADWMFGLFRTDSSGRKQHGITFLLVDMRSAGVKVEPILLFEGTHEVNQVFFDDVRVPVANRLGEEHQGWNIGKYVLGLERFGTAEVGRTAASLVRLKKLASSSLAGERPLLEDVGFAHKVADAEISLRALELTEQRFLFGPGGPDAMGPEASMLKVRGTEIQQQIFELTMEVLGNYTQVCLGPGTADHNATVIPAEARNITGTYFNFRKTSIYSGSNEIQKTIIAKAVLGL